MDSGHKGFGLALFVEAMTAALGGFGPRQHTGAMGRRRLLQIIDPGGFAGLPAFQHEAQLAAAACRATPVKTGNPAVRLRASAG